jgi:hypothetical protein
MKYKPCCGKRCLLANCKTREEGGCYCVCRLWDHIHDMQNIIDGWSFAGAGRGIVYIPDEVTRKSYVNGLTETQREEMERFKNEEAPKRLKELQERLKKYET